MATKDKKAAAVEAVEAEATAMEAAVVEAAAEVKKATRARKTTKVAEVEAAVETVETVEATEAEKPAKPKRAPRAAKTTEAAEAAETVAVAEPAVAAEAAEAVEPEKPAKKSSKAAEAAAKAVAEAAAKAEAKAAAKAAAKAEAEAEAKAAEDPYNIAVVNNKGEKVATEKLDEKIFGIAPNINVMHQVCRAQLAAERAGTHDTRTRGEVNGGGRKPFRQKGTGHARQGTIRAPQYKGGGVVFGPHPRSYGFKVNNKEVKLAMRSALSAKKAEGVLFVVDSFMFKEPSTKEAASCLKALKIEGRVTLMLTDDELNAFLSFRNVPRVRVVDVVDANTYDFIDNKALIFTKAALKHIEEVLK